MSARALLERTALVRLLQRVHLGRATFLFEDGSRETFGQGGPASTVRWSDRATRRTLTQGTLGFCDGYVDGDWSVVEGTLLDFLESMISARLNQAIKARVPSWLRGVIEGQRALATLRASRSVRSHYELDREFFAQWLDETLTYTCGYALSAEDDLETMQRQKLEFVCRKLHLEPGHRLLDLGCGWGSLAFHAARDHGVHVEAVNISTKQLEHAEQRAVALGLSDRVRLRRCDFGSTTGRFDRVAAIGIAEHVGRQRLAPFFGTIADRLVDDGIAVVHTIGSCTEGGTNPSIERRIFPGSYVPALTELVAHAASQGLRVGHVENLGPHYALTLRHWRKRFLDRRATIASRHGERFALTWEMYLTMLIPTFEHLSTGLYQLVLSKGERAPASLGVRCLAGAPLTPGEDPEELSSPRTSRPGTSSPRPRGGATPSRR